MSIPHLTGELEIGSEQCRELEAHLVSCQTCREQYERNKSVLTFIETHKAEFAQALESLDKTTDEQKRLESSWQRIEAKLDKIDAQERRARIRRFFAGVSAVAACLAIGISAWLVLSNPKKPEEPSLNQIASTAAAPISIEFLSHSGRIALPAGQDISTAVDELKTLIINGQHRLVMNANSTLLIEPFEQDSRFGCIVKLASGEIFAHVEHDGNPFVVSTAHGEAVITGTTFDIKTTDVSTTLVVTQGTVQFESEKGLVQVKSGQISMIAAQSAPTQPVSCNATKLTAWATGHEIEAALARMGAPADDYDLSDLWTSVLSGPIDLEEIDYDDWVEEKRDWFEREFPWIFQLKDALAKEGIKADYPELLIKTDDVWQFVCLDVAPARFSVIDLNFLLKIASDYGFGKQWLLENVPAARYALEKPVLLKNSLTALIAFEQCNSSFEDAQKSSVWVDYDDLYSLFHASVYLTETRSLIWFSVRDGQYDLTDKERAEVLALLQKQVNAANICQENALHQPYKKKQICDPEICKQDKWYQWADVVTKNINRITNVEKKIAEYQISQ